MTVYTHTHTHTHIHRPRDPRLARNCTLTDSAQGEPGQEVESPGRYAWEVQSGAETGVAQTSHAGDAWDIKRRVSV